MTTGDRDGDAKTRIIQTAMAMLAEDMGPEEITVRAVARRAGVSVGLINYHFGDKETLLNAAVGVTMEDMARQWVRRNAQEQDDPEDLLRRMLRELSEVAVQYETSTRIAVRYELLSGNMETVQYVLPVLRRIFGPAVSEEEVRVAGFEIISTLQLVLLRPDSFMRYSGIDVTTREGRERLIDLLVNKICGTAG